MGRAEDIFEKLKAEGEAAIHEFIALRQSEELYLDFKRSANDGRDKRLHNTDLNNLGKAISGFGNSEGGVIVWGVDASADVDGADVARLKMPVENIARFVSLLESSVSGRTLPPHPRVHHCSIELSNGQGFVATLIPKSSLAPHQSVPESKYYIRAGSNFIPAPHSVLAGMFGRRPQPEVFETFSFLQQESFPVRNRRQFSFPAISRLQTTPRDCTRSVLERQSAHPSEQLHG